MSCVIVPASPDQPAVAVAPLRCMDGGAVMTALNRAALAGRDLSQPPPSTESGEAVGEVVLRDGTRLAFGPDAPWRGDWLDGRLIVRAVSNEAENQLIACEIRSAALLGGRVELRIGAPRPAVP